MPTTDELLAYFTTTTLPFILVCNEDEFIIEFAIQKQVFIKHC